MPVPTPISPAKVPAQPGAPAARPAPPASPQTSPPVDPALAAKKAELRPYVAQIVAAAEKRVLQAVGQAYGHDGIGRVWAIVHDHQASPEPSPFSTGKPGGPTPEEDDDGAAPQWSPEVGVNLTAAMLAAQARGDTAAVEELAEWAKEDPEGVAEAVADIGHESGEKTFSAWLGKAHPAPAVGSVARRTFSDWEEKKHPRDRGRFAHKPGTAHHESPVGKHVPPYDAEPHAKTDEHDDTREGYAKTADSKAARIIERLKGLPAAAVKKAKAKVADTYVKLQGRYGKHYARAIVAFGLAGLPIPLPGASVMMAAPVLAVAELHRLVSGHGGMPSDPDPVRVRSGAGWFLRRVFGRVKASVGLSEFGSPRHFAWSEESHPRDDDGRFVSAHEIRGAAASPKRAEELRAKVTAPAEREKLDSALAGAKPARGGAIYHFEHGQAALGNHRGGLVKILKDAAKTGDAKAVGPAVRKWVRKTDDQIDGLFGEAKGRAIAQFRADYGVVPEGLADLFDDAALQVQGAYHAWATQTLDDAEPHARVTARYPGDADAQKVDADAVERFDGGYRRAHDAYKQAADHLLDEIEAYRNELGGKGKHPLGRYYMAEEFAHSGRSFADQFADHVRTFAWRSDPGPRNSPDRITNEKGDHLYGARARDVMAAQNRGQATPEAAGQPKQSAQPQQAQPQKPAAPQQLQPRGPFAPRAVVKSKREPHRTAFHEALADPGKIQPEHIDELKSHIEKLTRDEAKAKLRELGAKAPGRLKHEIIEGLLNHVRAEGEHQRGKLGVLKEAIHGHLGQNPGATASQLRSAFGGAHPLDPVNPGAHPVHQALNQLQGEGKVRAGAFKNGEPTWAHAPQPEPKEDPWARLEREAPDEARRLQVPDEPAKVETGPGQDHPHDDIPPDDSGRVPLNADRDYARPGGAPDVHEGHERPIAEPPKVGERNAVSRPGASPPAAPEAPKAEPKAPEPAKQEPRSAETPAATTSAPATPEVPTQPAAAESTQPVAEVTPQPEPTPERAAPAEGEPTTSSVRAEAPAKPEESAAPAAPVPESGPAPEPPQPATDTAAFVKDLDARHRGTTNAQANELAKRAAALTPDEARKVIKDSGGVPVGKDPVRQLVESIIDRQSTKLRTGTSYRAGSPQAAEFEAMRDAQLTSPDDHLGPPKAAPARRAPAPATPPPPPSAPKTPPVAPAHLAGFVRDLEGRHRGTKTSEANALARRAAGLSSDEARQVIEATGDHVVGRNPVRQLVDSIVGRHATKVRSGLVDRPGDTRGADLHAAHDEPLVSTDDHLAARKAAPLTPAGIASAQSREKATAPANTGLAPAAVASATDPATQDQHLAGYHAGIDRLTGLSDADKAAWKDKVAAAKPSGRAKVHAQAVKAAEKAGAKGRQDTGKKPAEGKAVPAGSTKAPVAKLAPTAGEKTQESPKIPSTGVDKSTGTPDTTGVGTQAATPEPEGGKVEHSHAATLDQVVASRPDRVNDIVADYVGGTPSATGRVGFASRKYSPDAVAAFKAIPGAKFHNERGQKVWSFPPEQAEQAKAVASKYGYHPANNLLSDADEIRSGVIAKALLSAETEDREQVDRLLAKIDALPPAAFERRKGGTGANSLVSSVIYDHLAHGRGATDFLPDFLRTGRAQRASQTAPTPEPAAAPEPEGGAMGEPQQTLAYPEGANRVEWTPDRQAKLDAQVEAANKGGGSHLASELALQKSRAEFQRQLEAQPVDRSAATPAEKLGVPQFDPQKPEHKRALADLYHALFSHTPGAAPGHDAYLQAVKKFDQATEGTYLRGGFDAGGTRTARVKRAAAVIGAAEDLGIAPRPREGGKVTKPLSEITKDFVAHQKSIHNHKPGSPGRQEIEAKTKAIRDEMTAALPPLDPDATKVREGFVRNLVPVIATLEQQVKDTRYHVQSGKVHMKGQLADQEKLLDQYKRGLDAAAHTDDSAWWNTIGKTGMAESVARGLAGQSGMIARLPKRIEPAGVK